MLLEVQVLGLHYLCPAVVSRVRQEPGVFGYRYATLEGHLERGVGWVLLTKNAHGDVTFRIEARWRKGQCPNRWSRSRWRTGRQGAGSGCAKRLPLSGVAGGLLEDGLVLAIAASGASYMPTRPQERGRRSLGLLSLNTISWHGGAQRFKLRSVSLLR